MNFPTAQPNYGYQAMPALAADPANHLAVALQPSQPCGPYLPVQLASYTVGSDGSLNTTNTLQNMPTPNVYPTIMNMSPSGQFLAVGGDPAAQNDGSTAPQTPGLQVFHFNGANPITTDSGTLTTAPIDEIHWDNSNHLYALSNSTGKLYVYTVTATGITAAPGSPYQHFESERTGRCADRKQYVGLQRAHFSRRQYLRSRQRCNGQLTRAGDSHCHRHRNHRQHATLGRWSEGVSPPLRHHSTLPSVCPLAVTVSPCSPSIPPVKNGRAQLTPPLQAHGSCTAPTSAGR